MTVTDNTTRQRFELEIDGHVAFADYRREGNVLHLPHVEAPLALRGTGAAGKLMQGIMEIARNEGLRVHPICSYAASWIEKHKEFHSLRA